MLRRSCPVRGPFMPGQAVMYWFRRRNVSRSESGRWHGPAKVIQQEGQSTVWLSHQNRIVRRPPENIRPMSLREWNIQERPPERTEESRKQESNRPPESMEAQMRFRDLRPISIPSTPDIQPEREITPNIQHDLTDLPDPSTGETAPNDEDTRVLGEAIDLEPSPDQPMESINEDNPDLDNPTNEEPALVLHCQPCNNVHKSPEKTQDLLTCVSATIGEDQGTCLLAEDGFSYIHDPMMPTEEQAFHLEIALTERDIDLWLKEANPEQLAHVATVGKRARAEVKLHTLTNAERLLFDAAKDKELSCWIQTNAIRPILRQRLNPEQILQSRWVLVWKEGDSPSQKRAKARLVVLG